MDLERKEKNAFLTQQSFTSNEIVLDVLKGANGPRKIVVAAKLQKSLKPHQIDGIKHMFNCCYGKFWFHFSYRIDRSCDLQKLYFISQEASMV